MAEESRNPEKVSHEARICEMCIRDSLERVKEKEKNPVKSEAKKEEKTESRDKEQPSRKEKPQAEKPKKAPVKEQKNVEKKPAPVKEEKKEEKAETSQNPQKPEKAVTEVKAAPAKPVNTEEVKDFLEKVFAAMDMKVQITITQKPEEHEVNIDLEGDDMGVLIGKRGQTLDSLQYLTSLCLLYTSRCV